MSQFVSPLLFEYFTIRVMEKKFKVCKITQIKVITKQKKKKSLQNIIHHSIRKIQIRSLELSLFKKCFHKREDQVVNMKFSRYDPLNNVISCFIFCAIILVIKIERKNKKQNIDLKEKTRENKKEIFTYSNFLCLDDLTLSFHNTFSTRTNASTI